MPIETIRDSVILSFRTECDRTRTLSVPDPSEGLGRSTVVAAADTIIGADLFDDAPGMPGRLRSLMRADLQKIVTVKLF